MRNERTKRVQKNPDTVSISNRDGSKNSIARTANRSFETYETAEAVRIAHGFDETRRAKPRTLRYKMYRVGFTDLYINCRTMGKGVSAFTHAARNTLCGNATNCNLPNVDNFQEKVSVERTFSSVGQTFS